MFHGPIPCGLEPLPEQTVDRGEAPCGYFPAVAIGSPPSQAP